MSLLYKIIPIRENNALEFSAIIMYSSLGHISRAHAFHKKTWYSFARDYALSFPEENKFFPFLKKRSGAIALPAPPPLATPLHVHSYTDMHTSVVACFLCFFYKPYMSFIHLSPLFFHLLLANCAILHDSTIFTFLF